MDFFVLASVLLLAAVFFLLAACRNKQIKINVLESELNRYKNGKKKKG